MAPLLASPLLPSRFWSPGDDAPFFLLPFRIQTRTTAERDVQTALRHPATATALLNIIVSDALPGHLRHLGAILLRKKVARTWRSLAPPDQTHLHAVLLTRLFSDPHSGARRAVAGLVATVARLACPRDLWPELLPHLAAVALRTADYLEHHHHHQSNLVEDEHHAVATVWMVLEFLALDAPTALAPHLESLTALLRALLTHPLLPGNTLGPSVARTAAAMTRHVLLLEGQSESQSQRIGRSGRGRRGDSGSGSGSGLGSSSSAWSTSLATLLEAGLVVGTKTTSQYISNHANLSTDQVETAWETARVGWEVVSVALGSASSEVRQLVAPVLQGVAEVLRQGARGGVPAAALDVLASLALRKPKLLVASKEVPHLITAIVMYAGAGDHGDHDHDHDHDEEDEEAEEEEEEEDGDADGAGSWGRGLYGAGQITYDEGEGIENGKMGNLGRDDPIRVAYDAMYALACRLPAKHVVVPALALLLALAPGGDEPTMTMTTTANTMVPVSSSVRRRRASLVLLAAVLPSGASMLAKGSTRPRRHHVIYQCAIGALSDPHPRVRADGLFLLLTLVTVLDLHGIPLLPSSPPTTTLSSPAATITTTTTTTTTTSHLPPLLPPLLDALRDPSPRVLRRACWTLEAILENYEPAELRPVIAPVLDVLGALLAEGRGRVRLTGMGVLAALAAAAGPEFRPHVAQVLPALLPLVQQPATSPASSLSPPRPTVSSPAVRARALEVAAMSLGAAGDAGNVSAPVLDALVLAATSSLVDASAGVREYACGFVAELADVVPHVVVALLDSLVPPILVSADGGSGDATGGPRVDLEIHDKIGGGGGGGGGGGEGEGAAMFIGSATTTTTASSSADAASPSRTPAGVHTGAVEERCAALHALARIAHAAGTTLHTHGHMSRCAHVVRCAQTSQHPGVRGQASRAWCQLLVASVSSLPHAAGQQDHSAVRVNNTTTPSKRRPRAVVWTPMGVPPPLRAPAPVSDSTELARGMDGLAYLAGRDPDRGATASHLQAATDVLANVSPLDGPWVSALEAATLAVLHREAPCQSDHHLHHTHSRHHHDDDKDDDDDDGGGANESGVDMTGVGMEPGLTSDMGLEAEDLELEEDQASPEEEVVEAALGLLVSLAARRSTGGGLTAATATTSTTTASISSWCQLVVTWIDPYQPGSMRAVGWRGLERLVMYLDPQIALDLWGKVGPMALREVEGGRGVVPGATRGAAGACMGRLIVSALSAAGEGGGGGGGGGVPAGLLGWLPRVAQSFLRSLGGAVRATNGQDNDSGAHNEREDDDEDEDEADRWMARQGVAAGASRVLLRLGGHGGVGPVGEALVGRVARLGARGEMWEAYTYTDADPGPDPDRWGDWAEPVVSLCVEVVRGGGGGVATTAARAALACVVQRGTEAEMEVREAAAQALGMNQSG